MKHHQVSMDVLLYQKVFDTNALYYYLFLSYVKFYARPQKIKGMIGTIDSRSDIKRYLFGGMQILQLGKRIISGPKIEWSYLYFSSQIIASHVKLCEWMHSTGSECFSYFYSMDVYTFIYGGRQSHRIVFFDASGYRDATSTHCRFHGQRTNEALTPTNIRTLRENVMVWKANVQLPTEPPVSYIQISILDDSRSQTLVNNNLQTSNK